MLGALPLLLLLQPARASRRSGKMFGMAARDVWALGDFPRVARELVPSVGPALVEACGIHAGQRVLDVAAGAGAVAIPAVEAGATVTASDITPELLAAGRAEAAERGVELEWVEADAQALPFDDDAFDVVTSSFGAMFAPDHAATAAELLRVCRPGGTIGMANWTPDGWIGGFFLTIAQHVPVPPPATPPALWGHEPYVEQLFGDRVASLALERRRISIDGFEQPADLVAFYKANFGPVIVAYASVAGDPERLAALDAAFTAYAERTNLGTPGGPTRYELEYLQVLAVAA
jgi:ubiquinone/menaquinone biosynthesis C-methylase UbiE